MGDESSSEFQASVSTPTADRDDKRRTVHGCRAGGHYACRRPFIPPHTQVSRNIWLQVAVENPVPRRRDFYLRAMVLQHAIGSEHI